MEIASKEEEDKGTSTHAREKNAKAKRHKLFRKNPT